MPSNSTKVSKNWPEKAQIGEPDGVILSFVVSFRGDNGENYAFYKNKSGFKFIIEKVEELSGPVYHLRSLDYFARHYGIIKIQKDEKAWCLKIKS